MTKADYDRTRKIPERKRATRNGKRALDSFVKSIRERLVVEHPEQVEAFDNDNGIKLLLLYFYFTKYIVSRFENTGIIVSTLCTTSDKVHYTDNILDFSYIDESVRKRIFDYMISLSKKES